MVSSVGEWSTELLNGALSEGDFGADLVLSKISSRDVSDSFGILRKWRLNSETVPAALPAYVRDFFEQSSTLPRWADPVKIMEAQRFFSRYPADLLAMHMYASLPECYATPAGASLLIHTNKLVNSTDDRLLSTARFVVDVMSNGSLLDQGRGIRSAQKIRWIHAVVRRQVTKSGSWDTKTAIPVNQEHLIGTLVAFSHVSLDALAKMGIRATPTEQSAYLHLWAVIGYLLGIREEYLPRSVDEARILTAVLRKRNQRPSAEGKQLMADLLEFSEKRFPGFAKGIPTAMVRELVPRSTVESLGVPEVSHANRFVSAIRIGFLIRNQVTKYLPPARALDFYNRVLVVNIVLWLENTIQRISGRRTR